MTYLTQAIVDKREALRHRFVDSYAWHRAIWQAFPSPEGSPRTFLSRVDDLERRYRIYALSDRAPVVQPWGQWATREIAPTFLEHDCYRFDLRANPTVKRVVRDEAGERKKNGRRTAIYDSEQLHTWLADKASQHGFEVLSAEASAPVARPFRRMGKPGKHVSVDFRGALRVVDRDRFRAVFHTGIGPAKAFGFGMLILQPIS